MCGGRAAASPFALHVHRAPLPGLLPGARYRYRVAGGGRDWPLRAPPAGGPTGEISFLVYGDMGETSHPEAKSPG